MGEPVPRAAANRARPPTVPTPASRAVDDKGVALVRKLALGPRAGRCPGCARSGRPRHAGRQPPGGHRLESQRGSRSSRRIRPRTTPDPLRVRVARHSRTPATIIANWIPGEDPAAGPELLPRSVPDRSHTTSTVDKKRQRPARTSRTSSGSRTQPSQFFLGNTQQSYHRLEDGRLEHDRGRLGSADAPGQHRAPRSTPRLRVARRRQGRASARRRHDRVRGAARRPRSSPDVGAILRSSSPSVRERRALRRRQETSLQATACTRSRLQDPQVRPRQRDEPHDRRGGRADRPPRRRSDGAPQGRDEEGRGEPGLGAGLPPREPADQRGRHPDEPQGSLERLVAGEGQAVSRRTTSTRSWRPSCRSSIAVRSLPGHEAGRPRCSCC